MCEAAQSSKPKRTVSAFGFGLFAFGIQFKDLQEYF
jgi:hypothetical protein